MTTTEEFVANTAPRNETERTLQELPEQLNRLVRERTASLEQSLAKLKAELTRREQAEAALKASEHRYQSLYENNPSMYFTLSREGTVLSVNQFGAEQLGYRQEDLVGHSVLGVFDRKDHEAVLGQLALCAASPNRIFEWELQKVRKNHSRLWVRERARAITDSQGALTILVVCEDITEHRKTTQLLATLVRESPLPIVSLDADARVTTWNQAATRLFGWTEQETVGRELPYVPPGEDSAADLLWEEGTRGAIQGPIEVRRLRKDGAVLDLLLWSVFIHGGSGELSTAVGLYVDQSELKRAEAGKLKSEARLRSFLDALDDLAFEIDEEGTYVNVWTRNEDNLLFPKQDIVRKRVSDVTGAEESARYLAVIRRVLATGQSESLDYALPVQGQLKHFSAILSRIPALGDTRATVACVVRDTTDQKRSADALQLSEQHLKSIIETSPECVKLVAADGTLLQVNAAGLVMIEADRAEDVLGLNVYDLVAPSHREAFQAMNERVCLGHKEFLQFEVIGLRGTARWMETHAVPLHNPADGTVAQLAIARDITERKRTEDALRQHERTLQQAREERERISQDLHDNILQSLYAVGMQLEASKIVAGKSVRKAKTHITHAVDQLNHLVQDVRHFIALLRTQRTTKLDFGLALRQLVASFPSTDETRPTLDLDPNAIPLIRPDVGDHLLSIAREALSNSVRHANAAHRSVTLHLTGTTIQLSVCDDGIGFTPGGPDSKGQGLGNIAARAQHLDARLILTSTPGTGTCVTIEMPTGKVV